MFSALFVASVYDLLSVVAEWLVRETHNLYVADRIRDVPAFFASTLCKRLKFEAEYCQFSVTP